MSKKAFLSKLQERSKQWTILSGPDPRKITVVGEKDSEEDLIFTVADIFDFKVELENYRFECKVRFHGCHFKEGFSAFNTSFRNAIDFSNCTFYKSSNIRDTSFKKQIFLSSCEFKMGADFSRNRYYDEAFFTSLKFKKVADFKGSKFEKLVDFHEAEFDGANFTSSAFEDKANFYKCSFSDKAHFRNCRFSSETTFSFVIFANGAEFDRSEFIQASFSNSSFKGSLSFQSSVFQGVSHFQRINTEVEYSSDPGNINFSNSIFKNTSTFFDSNFGSMIMIGADFKNGFLVSDEFNTTYSQNLDFCRIQKSNFIRIGDKMGIDTWKIREMEALSASLSWKGNTWIKLLLHINRLSNNHGVSYQQALKFLFIVSSVSFTILSTILVLYNKLELCWGSLECWSQSGIAFLHFVNPLSIFQKYLPWNLAISDFHFWTVLLMSLAKILIGFGVYQFVAAFRRHGKN